MKLSLFYLLGVKVCGIMYITYNMQDTDLIIPVLRQYADSVPGYANSETCSTLFSKPFGLYAGLMLEGHMSSTKYR